MTPVARALPACTLLLSAAVRLHAQSQVAWSQTDVLGDTSTPVAAVAVAPNANVVAVGEYRWPPGVTTSAQLQIRDVAGNSVASVRYPAGAGGSARWVGVAVDATGSIALAGSNGSSGLVGLADASGAFAFTPITLPAPFGRANAVAFDPNGDLLVVGLTSAPVNADVYVVRCSRTGALLGSQVWAHPAGGDDWPSNMAVGAQGDVTVVGKVDQAGVPRTFVLRLDAALGVVWEREAYSLQNAIPGPAVAIDAQGDAFVACRTAAFGQAFTLWKLDAAGTTQWERSATDATHSSGVAVQVAVDPFGDLVVAGEWVTGSSDEALVQKYDAAGSLLWSRPVASAPSPSLYGGLGIDAGGDVLVGGSLGSQTYVRRYDRDGNERWSALDVPTYIPQANRIGVVAAPDGRAIAAFGCSIGGGSRAARFLAIDAAWFPTCAGDGAIAACPCANETATRERAGCAHSQGRGGHLDGSGVASLASDTFTLLGTAMPATSTALYFQGDALDAPTLLGDGLRCAGGSLVRLGARINAGGASQMPSGGNPISVAGGVASPSTRWYQAWFRNAASFCTSATYNVTNAVRVSWAP